MADVWLWDPLLLSSSLLHGSIVGIFPRKEEIKVGHYTSPLAGALAQPASLQSRRNPIKKIQARRRFVLQFPMISLLFFFIIFIQSQ